MKPYPCQMVQAVAVIVERIADTAFRATLPNGKTAVARRILTAPVWTDWRDEADMFPFVIGVKRCRARCRKTAVKTESFPCRDSGR